MTRAKQPNTEQDQWYEEERLDCPSVAQVFQRIYATSAHFAHAAADQQLCVELAQALVRYTAWNDYEEHISVAELRNAVCCLCSFRSLQKRLQVLTCAVRGVIFYCCSVDDNNCDRIVCNCESLGCRIYQHAFGIFYGSCVPFLD